jgi:hypothetical protein
MREYINIVENIANLPILPAGMSYKDACDAILRNPYFIHQIDHPDQHMQTAAVENDYRAIAYIKHPTKETQLQAVRNLGAALQYFPPHVVPDDDVVLAAVSRTYASIRYAKNPPRDAIAIAMYHAPKITVDHLLKQKIPIPMDLLERAFANTTTYEEQFEDIISTLYRHSIHIPEHVLETAVRHRVHLLSTIIEKYGPPSVAMQLAACQADEHGHMSAKAAYRTTLIMIHKASMAPIDAVLKPAIDHDSTIVFDSLLRKDIIPSANIACRAISLNKHNLVLFSEFLEDHDHGNIQDLDEILACMEHAVRTNVKYIRFIKHPSESLQQAVIDIDLGLVVHIDHPSANILMQVADADPSLLYKIHPGDDSTRTLIDFIISHHN